jgi:hypothetical protein
MPSLNISRLGAYLCLPLAVGCGDGAEPADTEAATYEQVAELLGAGEAASGCAVRSCHGSVAEAGLEFAKGDDLIAKLVNVPSCVAPSVKLVVPGKPDESWLYIKLTAETNAQGDLVPDPSWGEPENCGQGKNFGKRMPRLGNVSWEAEKIEAIRSWIAAGAPGPGM